MYITKPFKCAFLALTMSCSQVWAEATPINSYIALKDALEQGEVPVIGVIDFGQCTHKYQNLKQNLWQYRVSVEKRSLFLNETPSMRVAR